jgi:NTP pyrophosphatase (non-canonical NTP hydrolase)
MPNIIATQSHMTFAEIEAAITTYLAARDWLDGQPRNLATSIVLEAAELLEHYQWSDKPVGSQQELGEELADILIYAFQFAYINKIDMAQAILDKLEKAKQKYPAENFKNKDDAERREAWMDAKLKHKKAGL